VPNLIHEDTDTLVGARTLYSTLSDNNGAATINDRRSLPLPPNDTSWDTHPEDPPKSVLIKGLSQFVGNTYKPYMSTDVYEYVFFDGSPANTPLFFDTSQTYVNNLQGKPHVYQRLYTEYNMNNQKLLIYKPVTDDTNVPVIVAFKGTDSVMDTIIDFHLFSSFAEGQEPESFDEELQDRINVIKSAVFHTEFGNYPVIFVAHSLGCAYASKAYEYFCNDDDYSSRMSQLYMFNPYILGGSNHESISEKCRTDLAFKNSINTYMSDADPFSLQFKANGFGLINVYPARDPTDESFIHLADVIQAINKGTYLGNMDHRYVNWTGGNPAGTIFHETTPHATQALPNVLLTTEHQTRVKSIRTNNTDFNVPMADGTTASHQMALQLDESNHMGTAHYPERNEDIDNYLCKIKPARLGHTANIIAKYKNVVSTLYQPSDLTDERNMLFSPVYVICSEIDGTSYYNYAHFYRRYTANFYDMYIAHLDYQLDIGEADYIKWLKVKANISPNQQILSLLNKNVSTPSTFDMDSIYIGNGVNGQPSNDALDNRNLTTFVIDDQWSEVSHLDTDELRRAVGGTIGVQPINRYAFAPGIIPQGPTGSEYVDVRMVFTQYTPHRFIVASETNYLTSVHKDSIWAVDPTDERYQTFDWRITWIESEQAYDIINIDNSNYSLAQFYLTAVPSTAIPLALSSITNKYFDIETVSVGSDIVCRIKSKENSKYVSFSDLWSTTDTYQANPGNDAYGALDPVIFESLLTTNVEKQYIQFASTTSPYDVYSHGTGLS